MAGRDSTEGGLLPASAGPGTEFTFTGRRLRRVWHQGWAPGSPAEQGGGGAVSAGGLLWAYPASPWSLGVGRSSDSQLRRRMGQRKRLHRQRVAATPTPPVAATITQR